MPEAKFGPWIIGLKLFTPYFLVYVMCNQILGNCMERRCVLPHKVQMRPPLLSVGHMIRKRISIFPLLWNILLFNILTFLFSLTLSLKSKMYYGLFQCARINLVSWAHNSEALQYGVHVYCTLTLITQKCYRQVHVQVQMKKT